MEYCDTCHGPYIPEQGKSYPTTMQATSTIYLKDVVITLYQCPTCKLARIISEEN